MGLLSGLVGGLAKAATNTAVSAAGLAVQTTFVTTGTLTEHVAGALEIGAGDMPNLQRALGHIREGGAALKDAGFNINSGEVASAGAEVSTGGSSNPFGHLASQLAGVDTSWHMPAGPITTTEREAFVAKDAFSVDPALLGLHSSQSFSASGFHDAVQTALG